MRNTLGACRTMSSLAHAELPGDRRKVPGRGGAAPGRIGRGTGPGGDQPSHRRGAPAELRGAGQEPGRPEPGRAPQHDRRSRRPRGVTGLLGSAYGGLAALRVAAYRRRLLPRARLSGPVISVGNLSVGASRKTPVVARVAAMLREEGLPVAVLSRGYRGSFTGAALVVSDGASVLASAEEAGDEPVMLARSLPGVVVAVGRRRD